MSGKKTSRPSASQPSAKNDDLESDGNNKSFQECI
jgi:hypothetical protein